MTMLPPIDCTGTHKVSYVRYSWNTMLHILTKRAFVNDFLFNGDSTFITASDFHTLPADTTLAWCCKEIVSPIGSQYNSIDSLITIENPSGTFHLGVLEHRGGVFTLTGGERGYYYDCVFGYFYDYTSPSIPPIAGETASSSPTMPHISTVWNSGVPTGCTSPNLPLCCTILTAALLDDTT